MQDRDWLIKYLEDIKDLLIKHSDELTEVKTTLASQQKSLDYHIKRTDLLEEQVNLLRNDLEPVEDHVKGIKFLGKVIGVISLIVGIAVGLFEILK